MSDKSSTVRVQPYTKELINKHAKRLGISQNDLIYKAILSAEKNNFEDENLTEKMLSNQVGRMIAVLTNRYKNLKKGQEDIFKMIGKTTLFDMQNTADFVFNRTGEEMRKQAEEFHGKGTKEAERYMKLYNAFLKKIYPIVMHQLGVKKE